MCFFKFDLSYLLCICTLLCCSQYKYNKTYLLHFCSTGKETSTHFLGLWSVLQQPRGTQLCLTTVLWPGCWVQDGLCPCPAWTWPLEQKASPLHCNKRRVDKGLIGFIFDRQMLQNFVSTNYITFITSKVWLTTFLNHVVCINSNCLFTF